MAIRTANKRAYLRGEGEKRQEFGITTVVVNSRQGGCPDCAPYIGRVFIDDVYSGGSAKDGDYPLLSEAISGGLFHPRCKDSTSTYYEGITTLNPATEDEINDMKRQESLEQQKSYFKNQAKKCERISKYSLGSDNKRVYAKRAEVWQDKAEKTAEKLDKTVAKSGESGIMKPDIERTAVSDVHKIGEIDIEKYKCVTNDILTNEVVITDPQIAHIKLRHPNDYERYFKYVTEILKYPDYILEANKPNTAFILKHITDNDKRYQLILRLKTSNDPQHYKNSVITFLKVEEKRYNRYLRTKKILYKSE